ncbi:hypothetical protein Glove_53g88 [Diversispora epigaea]|uniref:Uncharacterized protein n=1 Tax=Diversispora epigaea TaxID=1348612 RepID=A0A397JM04_9GLOM|nr:hypothetical protein Glove_53g88 [Diversispora epigaea]
MSFVQPWYLRFHAGHLRTKRPEAKFISRFYSSGFDNIKSNKFQCYISNLTEPLTNIAFEEWYSLKVI